jgi:cytochrome c6
MMAAPAGMPRQYVLAVGLAFATLWPLQPVRAGEPVRGGDLYRRHCAVCHGPNGKPLLPTAPDFTQPTVLMKPDLVLLATVRSGRGGMPAFQGRLRDPEILDIVAHLRTLR